MAKYDTSTFSQKLLSLAPPDRERILGALDSVHETVSPDYSPGAASILLDLGMDADTVIAALIMPLPEPSREQFGPVAALLARGAAKINSINSDNRTINEAQNIRSMIFALTEDIRVIILVLAEKLNGLRALDSPGYEGGSSPPDDTPSRKALARECIDIYAPLADRMGISWIKNEMEDLSLKFLNRETYQQIKDLVAEKRDERQRFLEQAREILRAEAEAAGIEVVIEGRAKHFYSVYMKMRKRGKGAAEIFDLSGIRIICGSVENCYTLLGIAHSLWKPVGAGFRDYIARPKPNGYRSLHTSVMFDRGPDEGGKTLEIQIRTGEMHQIAENGIASHWLYKKGSSRDVVAAQDTAVVKRLKDWKQGEAGDFSSSWLEGIKSEILRNKVFAFTPQGKVIKLPEGATPIDFAYHIHTAVGERCMGAKANGAIIPLSQPLKNTQVVEILTGSQAHPHFNWLELAKSSRARNKIRSWLERNDASHGPEKLAMPEAKKKPAAEVPAVPPLPEKKGPLHMIVQPLSSALQVRVEDEKNMMIRFAHCCSPVTGDPIIGYVSRGRGIIIHRKGCPSLPRNPEFEKRKIEVEWEHSGSALVKRFSIEAKFSVNLFSEIEGAIRKCQGHLIEGRLEEKVSNRLSGLFTMQLADADDLKPVLKNLRSIPGILSIQVLG